MKLSDIINRDEDLRPWVEGERIPWDDPIISGQVLKEHLSQSSSAASRQRSEIKKHCAWIQNNLLPNDHCDILDLGCGPGLYAEEFAKNGHAYTGIDIAPAAIQHAKRANTPNCEYILSDVRQASFGNDHDLVIYIFGAINLMPSEDVLPVLKKIYHALKPGGKVLIEGTSVESADQIGNQPSMWYSAEEGIFSASPHICLMESFWEDETNTATERYYIIDPTDGSTQRYCASTIGYEPEEIIAMLEDVGFTETNIHNSLTGEQDEFSFEFSIVSAAKPKR